MEFTYEGIVRCGFGFYNPNHAAAFICALSPFSWILFFAKQRLFKLLGAVFSIALMVALSLMLSRAGALVFYLELLAFALYFKKEYFKNFLIIGIFLILALWISGGSERVDFDTSASNRILIWLAGLKLFAGNLMGVGLGNSGEIASAFLLDKDIEIRTLVNSHLSLICEFGFFIGVLWFSLVFCALKGGFDKRSSTLKFTSLVAFSGLILSAFFSSIFDWEVLINPLKFEYLSFVNLSMSYGIFIFFCGLCFYLAKDGSLKNFITAFCILGMAFLPLFYFSQKLQNVPKVRKINQDCFVQNCEESPYGVVIFDDDYSLNSAMKILKKLSLSDRILIAKNSWQNKESLPLENAETYILFGHCADFISKETKSNMLINPPRHFKSDSANLSKIYIPKWESKYGRLRENFPQEKLVNFYLKVNSLLQDKYVCFRGCYALNVSV